eukprot:12752578-Alexandrium_andersonii.AAC.1
MLSLLMSRTGSCVSLTLPMLRPLGSSGPRPWSPPWLRLTTLPLEVRPKSLGHGRVKIIEEPPD